MSDSAYVTTFEMDVQGDSETSGKLDSLAGKVKNVGEQGDVAASKTSSFTKTLKSSALGLTAAATSAVSLYSQYDQLEKRSQSVEKQELAVSKANEEVSKAQAKLNALVTAGTVSGGAFEQAQLDLSQAQDKLTLKTKDLNIAQGDLSQAQMGFALQIVPTAITSVTSLNDVFSKLKTAKIANAAASGAEAIAEKGSMLSRWASIPSMFAATAATQGYGMAIKGAMIAMGPLGWALIGISTVMGLFATNAFGIRDAINAAGKAIGDAFPIMRPLLDGLSSLAKMIFPEAEKSSETAADTISASMSTAATEGSSSFEKLAAGVDSSADDIVSDAKRIETAMSRIGARTKATDNTKPVTSNDAGYSWIGFGQDLINQKAAAMQSSGSSSGGGAVKIEIMLSPDLERRIISKSQNVDVVFNSH